MEFVCLDQGSRWMFDPTDVSYHRIYDNNNQGSMVFGRFLPDPILMTVEREKMSKKTGLPVRPPTDAVKALWEHYQKHLDDKRKSA